MTWDRRKLGKDIPKTTYHCEDCIACEEIDHPEQPIEFRCKFDNTILRFNVETKAPCKRFHPEDYIKALNADSVTRD